MLGKSKKIPFAKPFIVGKELFYMAQAVMNGSIAGDGIFTKKCQQWLERELGTPKALLTHSCTAALEMAAILADIGPGDEVIMPSFTFVSSANAFVLRGGVPVFVDIRPDTLNLDESKVEAAITSRTKAIVAVHYAGQACALEALQGICRKHGLLLIEDAAQAILSRSHDKALGAIGDLGCLSFHETKNVICGEGGALLINNPDLIARAEVIWQKGTNRKAFFRGEVDKYTWVDIGSSFLPNELTAAFLFAQLEQAKRINTHRCNLFRRYQKALQPLASRGLFQLPQLDEDGVQNAHLFYLMCASEAQRDELIRHLGAQDISAVFHYVPLHSSPAGMRLARAHGRMDVTERISSCLVRLPLFSEMTVDQVDVICREVGQYFSSTGATAK
ncbi:dTDP-4-amino-4,6-dideoxygalactose transaminase [Chromobacterium paludis]|uniref:dTDP-4-amino-4,6-dideoxygalactose transaminase n=1 Tax=Chromobacterium paludis TaxID=2605945 RepID=A0A5C1DIX9_9NEIS|nr:dTDP-4-amino-4,6-dideoxygalactose transaminase [Chromobacterium paludis]QEL56620.1 dTDP-4-amino-4,6-dideoxygalactose transaminase [Chromobacterium paludis]